jgi:hypothetical protein
VVTSATFTDSGADTGLDMRVSNSAVDTGYSLQGGYIKAKNTGTVDLVRGLNVEVASESGTATKVVGQEIAVQNDGTTAVNKAIGLAIRNSGAGVIADIQLSGGASATIKPEIRSGSGVPDNADCTAATNLGSLYINTAGTAAAHTLLYVCTESGNWIAVQSTTGF